MRTATARGKCSLETRLKQKSITASRHCVQKKTQSRPGMAQRLAARSDAMPPRDLPKIEPKPEIRSVCGAETPSETRIYAPVRPGEEVHKAEQGGRGSGVRGVHAEVIEEVGGQHVVHGELGAKAATIGKEKEPDAKIRGGLLEEQKAALLTGSKQHLNSLPVVKPLRLWFQVD